MVVAYEREAPLAPPAVPGPYRVADYLALPDEPRCELVLGRFYAAPAPIIRHQEVVGALYALLRAHAREQGARLVLSPVDVVLAEHSVVQPDLVYVRAERAAIVGDRVAGAPDLVAEVLSPASARRDPGEKLALYAEAGVGEYGLVDAEAKTFEFLRHRGSSHEVRLPAGGRYASEAVPGFVLDLESFGRSLPG
jgi:Uma2 family endonuclease